MFAQPIFASVWIAQDRTDRLWWWWWRLWWWWWRKTFLQDCFVVGEEQNVHYIFSAEGKRAVPSPRAASKSSGSGSAGGATVSRVFYWKCRCSAKWACMQQSFLGRLLDKLLTATTSSSWFYWEHVHETGVSWTELTIQHVCAIEFKTPQNSHCQFRIQSSAFVRGSKWATSDCFLLLGVTTSWPPVRGVEIEHWSVHRQV